MDEIHERDKNADFLLIELRRMIVSGHLQLGFRDETRLDLEQDFSNPYKRLVIMSATIDLEFFIEYFQKENITPAVASIEGRTGTVERYFLEDIYTIPSCAKHMDGNV